MTLPEPLSWYRDDARTGKLDGKFILGVMTTGIYCLPSCAARPPKPQNVRLFTTEAAAKAAGLRACKRCRPDLYYKGEDENVALFAGLAARVAGRSEDFSDASALAKEAGVSLTKLGDLFRDHAHLAPASWLRRLRVKRAAQELLTSRDKVTEIGFGAGFEFGIGVSPPVSQPDADDTRRLPGTGWGAGLYAAIARRLPGQGNPGLPRPRSLELRARKAKAIVYGRPCIPATGPPWWRSASNRGRPG